MSYQGFTIHFAFCVTLSVVHGINSTSRNFCCTFSYFCQTKMFNIKTNLWSGSYGAQRLQLIASFFYYVSPASESESDVSPEKRARVGDMPEGEESSSSSLSASSSSSPRSGSKQRSRKRCHRCQTKLELVQQELGSCRCGTITQLYTHINIHSNSYLNPRPDIR